MSEKQNNTHDKEKKSLVTLTQDFLEMLINGEGQEVDITQVEKTIEAPKRRLYDVTNVLSGIGAIERTGKSKVRWTGLAKMESETEDYAKLAEDEAEIDRMARFIDEEMTALAGSDDFKQFAYVTKDDVEKLVNSNDKPCSFFALKGPSDLTIEVPDSDIRRHNINCYSEIGGIDMIQV